MSAPVSLAAMRASVRRRANIESQVAFIGDAELDEYINEGGAELYDMLIGARSQPFYRRVNSITTVSGTSAYTLPTDFYQLVSVDVTLGGSIVLSILPYGEEERNIFQFYPGWFYNSRVRYRLIGQDPATQLDRINFLPTPLGTYPVSLNYYPIYKALVGDTDTFDGVNGWEAFMVWYAVAICQAKGEEDPSFAQSMCGNFKSKIEGLAAMRDAGSAERVKDVVADFEVFP